jgi:hypothetical protein
MIEKDGPEIRDRISTEIREWFISYKEKYGKFPIFPLADEGGSMKVLGGISLAPEQPGGETNEGTKRPPPSRRKQGKEEEKKPLIKLPPSNFLADLQKGFETKRKFDVARTHSHFPSVSQLNSVETYQNIWYGRDESGNLQQKYDVELTKMELRPQVEKEV